MLVRRATESDGEAWLAMRHAIWPKSGLDLLRSELAIVLNDPNQVAFVAEEGGRLVGFAELSLHPYAMGCTTTPVAYMEGWWVEPDWRRRGVGAALIAAGEVWGRERGCTELASDTWLDNEISDRAHLRLGFEEAGRLIHYRKSI